MLLCRGWWTPLQCNLWNALLLKSHASRSVWCSWQCGHCSQGCRRVKSWHGAADCVLQQSRPAEALRTGPCYANLMPIPYGLTACDTGSRFSNLADAVRQYTKRQDKVMCGGTHRLFFHLVWCLGGLAMHAGERKKKSTMSGVTIGASACRSSLRLMF